MLMRVAGSCHNLFPLPQVALQQLLPLSAVTNPSSQRKGSCRRLPQAIPTDELSARHFHSPHCMHLAPSDNRQSVRCYDYI